MALPTFHLSSILRASVFAFAAVFAAIFAVIALVRDHDDDRYLERRYADVSQVLAAAIDPRFQSKADEITRVAERLVAIGAVKGGILYDGSGHEQQVFGERTEASFQSVMRTGRTVFRSNKTDRADFYFPPETSGTPFHIILRAAVGEITSLETIRDGRAMTIALFGAVAAAAIAELLMIATVWWPLRKVRVVVEAMLADPSAADRGQPLRPSGGEVGKVTFAVECLRSMLADFWRTRVQVADTILESSPFAVLQLNSDGAPFFANSACTRLFERDILRTIAATPLVLRDIESGARVGLKAFIETYKSETRFVEFPTPKGPKQALIAALVIGANTRAPVNLLMAIDISVQHAARLTAEANLRSGQEEVARAATRTFEYKLMLEACLALLGGGNAPEAHLEIASFAREWLDTASESGLVVHAELGEEDPEVAGGADDLRAVVRLAAFVAYSQLGTVPVGIKMEMRGIDFETAGLQVQARSLPGAKTNPCVADANLAVAALRTVLARVGGQLSETEVDENGSMVRILLRGAAERMHTTMAKSKA